MPAYIHVQGTSSIVFTTSLAAYIMATLKAGGSDRQLARRKRRRESAEKKVRVRVGLAGSHLPGMLLAHSTPAVARRPRARGMHTKSAVRWALDTEALTCHLRTATNTRPPTTLEALERGAWPGGSWAGLSLLAAPCRGIEAFELVSNLSPGLPRGNRVMSRCNGPPLTGNIVVQAKVHRWCPK